MVTSMPYKDKIKQREAVLKAVHKFRAKKKAEREKSTCQQ